MKKLLNFGLIAGLVLSFSALGACSGSDSDNGGSAGGGGSAPVVNGKRLVKVTENDNSTSYVYNSKGQVIKSERSLSSGWKEVDDYVYTDSMIVRSHYSSSYSIVRSHYYYFLENGRVVRDSVPNYYINNYEYDGAGQLITIRTTYKNSYRSVIENIIWQNGNIVKTESDSSGDKHTFIYTYTSHPNTLPILNLHVEPVLYSQGYFGRICKNLPSELVFSDTADSGETSTSTTTYDYTFENGVVTKVIESNDSGGNAIYHFTWE